MGGGGATSHWINLVLHKTIDMNHSDSTKTEGEKQPFPVRARTTCFIWVWHSGKHLQAFSEAFGVTSLKDLLIFSSVYPKCQTVPSDIVHIFTSAVQPVGMGRRWTLKGFGEISFGWGIRAEMSDWWFGSGKKKSCKSLLFWEISDYLSPSALAAWTSDINIWHIAALPAGPYSCCVSDFQKMPDWCRTHTRTHAHASPHPWAPAQAAPPPQCGCGMVSLREWQPGSPAQQQLQQPPPKHPNIILFPACSSGLRRHTGTDGRARRANQGCSCRKHLHFRCVQE